MDQNIFSEYLPYLFLVLGFIVIGYSLFAISKRSKLKETGIPVDGIVYKQEYNNSNQSFDVNSSDIKDKITVRFVTLNKEWITGEITQDFQLFYSRQYKDGETIKVYYDQSDPSNFYVETKQTELIARVVLGIVGVAFIVYGLFELSQ